MPPSSATAYQSLQGYKRRDTQSTLQEAEQKYGIPERQTRLSNLRGLVGNLQSSVEAVDPSVTGRTSGTFTTEGQRQALVNRERAPILTDLSKQQQALGVEQAGFSEAQGLAGQMASALLNEDQQTYQQLLDQYNVAVAAEREAEQKRQWEAQQAEARRQFDMQIAETRRQYEASQRSGYDIQSILKSLNQPSQASAEAERQAALEREATRQRLAQQAKEAADAQQAAQRQNERYNTGSWNQQFGNWLKDSGSTVLYRLFGGS